MIDSMGGCWPVLPEKNDRLMACDPTLRFEAVLFNMNMCLEIFGLMRRSALARTSLLGTFFGADKVMLAQMSLLGPFWLGQETLAFRRCHAQQSSYSASLVRRGTPGAPIRSLLSRLSGWWPTAAHCTPRSSR